MYKNKRKRDAIEATVFERNVKTRLKSDSLGPKDSKTISFPKRLSIEDTINSFPLKKSSIRTTSSKLSTSQITTFQDKASNKLFQYLLEKDKSNIVKGNLCIILY